MEAHFTKAEVLNKLKFIIRPYFFQEIPGQVGHDNPINSIFKLHYFCGFRHA
jgi:hypothetical protein